MSLPERLRLMNEALAQPEPPLAQRLGHFLAQAADLLDGIDLPGLLSQVLGGPGAVWAMEQSTGYVHLGFTAPPGCHRELLAELASQGGFESHQAFFRAEIMSKELAWRLGRDDVPTSIFRADARAVAGLVRGVEAFLPAVEPEVTEDWIRDGVGTHFACGLATPEAVEAALQLCLRQGFNPPPFFQGHPLLNVANAITVIYVEAVLEGEQIRWEFYHARGEAPV